MSNSGMPKQQNFDVRSRTWTYERWMTVLPDDLPISEINIPGAHNAAAIRPTRPTRWACQCHSISEQLLRGIRMLDIRLKPKPRVDKDFEFITCHGRRGVLGQNEFQRFETLIEECANFLNANPGEMIIMTMQIDDWRRVRRGDRLRVLQVLQDQVGRWPIIVPAHLPTLGECRGKIFLMNRVNDDPALGVPLGIPDNTPGVALLPGAHRHYEIYVQDRYKGLDRRRREADKLRLTLEAFEHKKPGVALLNFASATKPIGRFVYIMRELLESVRVRPALGWLFLDYALTVYETDGQETIDLPTLLIDGNFNVVNRPFAV